MGCQFRDPYRLCSAADHSYGEVLCPYTDSRELEAKCQAAAAARQKKEQAQTASAAKPQTANVH